MPSASQLKFLIVDDQASMRRLTRYSLEQLGIRDVDEAIDGSSAMELIKIKRYDMIISDWNMEPVDGLQLLKAIRANPLTARTPFIMSTGNKDRAKVKAAVAAGVNNYIVKPFNVTGLKKKIEDVIGSIT